MLNDTPWEGLGLGGVDSRRVDHAGKWNFFWAVMPRQEPALALTLQSAPNPMPRLPTFKSLETGFATLSGGLTFYIRLKDISQLGLFEVLCRDVIDCAEHASTEVDALARAVGRTCRWHHLLRGGTNAGLTEEEQKGLIGELTMLEWLAGVVGCRPAITAWTGPMGSPKDFELHGHCIEVKARRSAAQPFVQISNEFQLADVQVLVSTQN
ncbi:PD-(D/E)XK motif protein [Rhizobium tumorigenes]|uniref:PD-(D/E)XK motif protein n=1 Tax=Rhizobium tumorigenes TaxID=2041385 RepID=UPI00241F9E37|nr:PD-(D/E)XK motif protein [Rhizobium tumorigenes]WFR99581.1 PD-(D/E)XK motif protein [Rhizobium tumorigenes]